MKIDLAKDIKKAVREAMDDYVVDTCVPTTSKMIKEKCNKGWATGKLADSVYYDKTGEMAYVVYVEAFDKYGTNYAKYADQGRGPVKPVWASKLVFTAKNGNKIVTSKVRRAKGAKFIAATKKELRRMRKEA